MNKQQPLVDGDEAVHRCPGAQEHRCGMVNGSTTVDKLFTLNRLCDSQCSLKPGR